MKLEKFCMDCGKDFIAWIRDSDGRVMRGIYWGSRDFGLGMRYLKGNKNKDGSWEFERTISVWKWYWYALIEWKRKILRQYERLEFWQCPTCIKKEQDIKT